MQKITINGKEYEVKKIDFQALVELEKVGFNITTLQNLQERYWGAINSLVAFTIGCDEETATKEIESHISNGGKITDFTILIESITNSDFFQKLSL